MKYLEVTFTTHPCNETVNDVVSALAGEIGFESFVECVILPDMQLFSNPARSRAGAEFCIISRTRQTIAM